MYFLKYRPQTIEELDLELVREQFEKVLARQPIPQAFLFAGPKGTGKTSAARILAKAINCQSQKVPKPCNNCPSCKEITDGISLDVIEMDAASNRGIDDIRQIKERVALSPLGGNYKVYIIDEVHMLTKEAFNALLKTLEEPPAHVVFVLCTTDPEKIIPTVLSRLFRIEFNKGNRAEMLRSLSKVVKGEKLTIDQKVLELTADLADGGFRDAQKNLESLVLSLGKKITFKAAEEFLGRWQGEKPKELLKLISQNELGEVLKIADRLSERGVDFDDYLRELLNGLRQIILLGAGVGDDKELIDLSVAFPPERWLALARLFQRAVWEQKSSVLPQLPLQLALVEFLSTTETIEPPVGGKPTKKKGLPVKQKEDSLPDSRPKPLSATGVKLTEIEGKWAELLNVLKPMNHSVSALLRAARPKKVDRDTLVIEVFYSFHKEKLDENRNRQIIEDGLLKLCQSPLRVRCVLGEKPKVDPKPEPEPAEIVTEKSANEDELYNMAKDIFGN
ncbi:MAG: DNA polymerase III subunit gamma/tau [Patescibacteria group bacterium]